MAKLNFLRFKKYLSELLNKGLVAEVNNRARKGVSVRNAWGSAQLGKVEIEETAGRESWCAS